MGYMYGSSLKDNKQTLLTVDNWTLFKTGNRDNTLYETQKFTFKVSTNRIETQFNHGLSNCTQSTRVSKINIVKDISVYLFYHFKEVLSKFVWNNASSTD